MCLNASGICDTLLATRYVVAKGRRLEISGFKGPPLRGGGDERGGGSDDDDDLLTSPDEEHVVLLGVRTLVRRTRGRGRAVTRRATLLVDAVIF